MQVGEIDVFAFLETNFDEFHDSYVEAALWSSTDESDESGGRPTDENYSSDDLDDECKALMRKDCTTFIERSVKLLLVAERLYDTGRWAKPHGRSSVVTMAGHDFWLTRNGHGAGFWDGDWPKGIGEGLDAIAKTFGEFNLYVNDSGTISGG